MIARRVGVSKGPDIAFPLSHSQVQIKPTSPTASPRSARASGVYGLFRLDRGAVDPGDAATLALAAPVGPVAALVEGHDGQSAGCVHRHDARGSATVVVGEVEQVGDLATRLGLSIGAPVALIAEAALERFGSNLASEMVGEWSLLRRDAAGRVTLAMSGARRDRLLFAQSGQRLAVAPDLFALARIGWIGNEVDETALTLNFGTAPLRAAMDDRTMLVRVRQVHPGQTVTIDPDGTVAFAQAAVLTEQPRRSGSFADLVDEAEATLRTIMRERLARTPRAALLVSGGLDSSLLAWLAAAEQRDTAPQCLTSVAPPGSSIPDESRYADCVAAHLGLAHRHVAPAWDADTYRPIIPVLAGAGGPPVPNRHALTQAFQLAAHEAGATLLVNGSYGEMTATARLGYLAPGPQLRALAGRLRRDLFGLADPGARAGPFQVRLAPHRLAALPEPVRSAIGHPHAEPVHPARGDLLGYLPGTDKMLAHPNEFYAGAVRMDFPFRDLRLLRLFAGFPLNTLLDGGHDRPMVRAMLAGRLPDEIRLRRAGMPASPDHFARLQRQAPAARGRIAAFRKAGVDDWLDLEWLDSALGRVGARGAVGYAEANQVQLTAIAAEFLTWWRARS